MIAPKSAIDAAATISWPNVDEISPASLSTGTSTPSEVAQRMIATSSGVSTSPPAVEPERDDERDREREREAERGQPQHAPAQPLELDLEAGEEQHEREPEEREHLDRLVDLDPAEHRRADDDPGDDLEHDRRQPHAREEAEQERRRERDGETIEEVAEGGHAAC